MHKLMRASLLGAAIAGLALAHSYAADNAAGSEMSGTMVGNAGGTIMNMDVTLPANMDVELKLAHWPCGTGNAIGVNVWNAGGWVAKSTELDACTQHAAFNTGSGGKAQVQVYNYLDGVGTWYTLSSMGFSLPGASAPAPAMAPAKEAAAETSTAAASTEAKAATTTAAAESSAPTTAAAPKPAAGAINVINANLLGNVGGATADYHLTVKEGQSYTVKMTYATPSGGTWPGVGFKVWGPGGWVADGWTTEPGHAEATFKATGDVVYLVQPYNYHHGLLVFYSLESSENK